MNTGFFYIGLAALIAAINIPLILRKIPMNRFYGVRFPQSFKSDAQWYEINYHGGRALLLSAVPVLIVGIAGLPLPGASVTYELIASAVLIVSVLTAGIWSYQKARKIDQQS